MKYTKDVILSSIKVMGLSLLLAFGAGSVQASGQGSFAVLNGAQVEALDDSLLSSTYGKHFTINLPNGNTVNASGTNGAAFSHATLTLGGGAADLSGLPCAVCDHH